MSNIKFKVGDIVEATRDCLLSFGMGLGDRARVLQVLEEEGGLIVQCSPILPTLYMKQKDVKNLTLEEEWLKIQVYLPLTLKQIDRVIEVLEERIQAYENDDYIDTDTDKIIVNTLNRAKEQIK